MEASSSSSFDFDRVLAYALSCVKQEGLSLKDQQVEAVKLLSEGKDVFVWFPTGYGKSIIMLPRTALRSWVGPTLPSLTEVSFLLFLPLCLIVHEYYFPCHLSVFSLNFTIVLRHVLLLNLRSQPTRPYTINTRPYFSPAVILAKNRPGDEALHKHALVNHYLMPHMFTWDYNEQFENACRLVLQHVNPK